MVHAEYVFVAGIHPSRTWMSGSFESVQWNACVHRLDLGLHSHPKEFWGDGVRTHVNSKGKIPSTGKILHRVGSNPRRCIMQDSEQNTLPTELSRPPQCPLFPLPFSLTSPLTFSFFNLSPSLSPCMCEIMHVCTARERERERGGGGCYCNIVHNSKNQQTHFSVWWDDKERTSWRNKSNSTVQGIPPGTALTHTPLCGNCWKIKFTDTHTHATIHMDTHTHTHTHTQSSEFNFILCSPTVK